MAKDRHFAEAPAAPVCSKCQHEEMTRYGNSSDLVQLEEKGQDLLTKEGHHSKLERRRLKKGGVVNSDSSFFKASRHATIVDRDDKVSQEGFSGQALGDPLGDPPMADEGGACVGELGRSIRSLRDKGGISDGPYNNANFGPSSEEVAGSLKKKAVQEVVLTADRVRLVDRMSLVVGKTSMLDSHPDNSFMHETYTDAMVPQNRILEQVGSSPALQSFDAPPSGLSSLESLGENSEGAALLQSEHVSDAKVGVSHKEDSPLVDPVRTEARSRWKRAAHSVKFINHMAANIRSAPTDLIEDRVVDEMLQQQATGDDAGGVGAAAFEGAKTVARSRSKGRKGMEGLLVQQDRGFITFFQDFYVACLKMAIGHFLVGVFLAPLVLGLLFTPLYLLDVDGLSFNGVVPEDATTSPLVSARQRCLAFLNIFLYALSLSTTFGGAPVAARSPFCLLVANVNTLMAQFLFVFLSGAVFARMSQPSYPIRCSKKAIIKIDDLLPVLGLEQQEKYKAFAVRLVLTGPSPCELVDAKICLTFRIFVTLPSGSVFCSTQDLEVVHPEVSYLRYGLMVRHIIDKKSPVYGHTMESLRQGDASFSLTVMGMERASMQPIFHLEDYFVCDDDVIWEGDYEDFIHINERGQRVLDHSQIDRLKPMKVAATATQAVVRMKNLSQQKQKEQVGESVEAEPSKEVKQASNLLWWRRNWPSIRRRTSKSSSFTRADW